MKKFLAFLIAPTFIMVFFLQTTTATPAFGNFQNRVVSNIPQKPDAVTKTTQIAMTDLDLEIDKKAERRKPFIAGNAAAIESPFQAMRGAVSVEGLLINSTSTEEGPGNFSLRPLSYSKGEVNSVSKGTISIENDAVLLNRGNLTERFTASTYGIRQDFIISASPAGAGDLSLELELRGAKAANSLNGVSIIMDNGRKLEYHRLFITDAFGKSFPGEMKAISEDHICISVHDSGAAYPLTIDPTITDANWLVIGGLNGSVLATVVSGTDVYVGGNFTTAGGASANYIAKWNGSAWSALSTGLNGSVSAIAVNGSDVYVGGSFTLAGDVAVEKIAKWDGSAWSALGSGLNGSVTGIAVNGSDVYVVGAFSSAGGNPATRIAKWNGSAWSALGSGTNNSVYSITVSGSDVYVGGDFSLAGGVSANRIAKWDGSTWSGLGTGFNSRVNAIAVSGSDVYVGGSFTLAGAVSVEKVAKWDGTAWSALGSGLNNTAYAVAVSGSNVFVGGVFTWAGSVQTYYIAKWDGSAWSALGSGTYSPGIASSVNAVAMSGTTELIVGGYFTTAGGKSSPNLAKVNLVPVSVTATSGTTTGSYETLKAAFDKINDGTHQGTITIKINNSITETASAVLNASASGSASYTSVNIYPTTTGLSISGNLATPLIDLNGADNVIIDGRVNATGSSKDLIITNTSTSSTAETSTIRFINDASGNTVKYCTIKGSSTTAYGGVLYFSSTTGTSGNDDNTIEQNDITSSTDANRPVNAIGSIGASSKDNSGNIIRNNSIFNFLSRSMVSYGINLWNYNTTWTITGNSFYETASFVPTSSVAYYAINIYYTSGTGFTVDNNYIGGSAASCGGTAWTKTAAFNNTFTAINLNVGTGTATSVQGNIIRNFAYANSLNASWYGINISAGEVNTGTTTGNTIGATSGNGSITLTNSTASGCFYGISIAGSGTTSTRDNTIASITAGNTSGANNTDLKGIYSTATGIATISNNSIGSTDAGTSNSINASSTSSSNAQTVYGISNTGTGTVTISANTISKLTNGTTNTTAGTAGVINGIATSSGSNTVTNNTVRDLTISNANTSSTNTASVIGINQTSTTAGQTLTGNTIYNLSNSYASFAGYVIGLFYNGGTTGTNSLSKNFIHSLSANSASASLYGLKIDAGTATYSNNIISLGTGITNGNAICGIQNYGLNNSLYFNTIDIEGTVTGETSPTYALKNGLSPRNYRNNIFNNSRSGGTSGIHYAVWLNSNQSLTMDYNDYYAPNGVLGNLGGDKTTLADWKTATGQDSHSKSSNPGFASAGGNSAANYLPSEATLLAVTGTGILEDYAGTTRSLVFPSMGAYSYSILPPAAAVTSVSVPTNDTYVAGNNLDFTVNYDQAVTVSGFPTISVTLNTGGTVVATYLSGSGSTAIVFRYTVVSGNYDNDGISLGSAITLTGGSTIKNNPSTDAGLVLNSVAATTGVLVDAVVSPTTQASAITFSDVKSDEMNITWTNGNGAKRAVFVKEGTGTITNPTNLTTYTASVDWTSKGTQLGTSGYYCVYNDSGNSFILKGLNASTQYSVQVFEYNGDTGLEKYYTATASDNPKSQSTTAAPIEVTTSVDPTPVTYASLETAFDAINDGTHTGAITVKIKGSTVETGTAVLNASSSPSSYTSVNIYPTTTGLSITGDLAAPLIDLNGADNVTIDGRANATGSAKDLVITNTSTATSPAGGISAIRFTNDASNNTVKYCTIKASSASLNSGIIYFSSSYSGSTGNDNNTIDHNNITSADDANRPLNAICSLGTSAKENSGNTISNNNIYDFLNRGAASYGIKLGTNNTDWTISGNNFYETANFVPTNDLGVYYMIYVQNAGVNYTISGNSIGGTAASCGGSAFTKNRLVADNNQLTGILLSTGAGAVSNIQGNTIANIRWTNTNDRSFTGIRIEGSGDINIGTTTGNTIGASTGTGSITLTNGNDANSYGIYSASSGAVDIQNNHIGSITAVGSDGIAHSFYGIYKDSAYGAITISNNEIGSTVTANSINASSTSIGEVNQFVYGIYSIGTSTSIISGNTITNLNNATNGSWGQIVGIKTLSGRNTISNNIVRNLSTANQNTQANHASSIIGISQSSPYMYETISGNTIYNLSNSYATFAGNVIGLHYDSGEDGTNSVSKNFIHSLSTTSASASLYGIKIDGGTATYSNNIISLGSGITVGNTIYGIKLFAGGSNTISLYFNTVDIEGTVAGASGNTYGLSNMGSNTRIYKNNVFKNARSSTSGNHYALYILYPGDELTCDYNDYYVSGTGGILGYYGENKTVLPIVTDVTGNDANSKSVDPGFATPGGTSSADYQPSAASLAAATGTGILTDYTGTTRSLTGSVMGALEHTSPVTVAATAGTANGQYATLKGAFDAINAGTHMGVVTVRINSSTTESASAILNASASGSASYTSINVYPTATGLSVTGNLAAPLIDLRGADNATIDGRVNATGSTKDLVISNTSAEATAGTSTIRFINDATSNAVKYCTVKGSSTDAAGGILFFSTTTGTTGNDNNLIDNNSITNSTNANRPVNAIYSLGTSTKENSGNTISNNNFYDFLNRGLDSYGINLGNNTTTWTISSNSFYETASFVPTADAKYRIINIDNTSGIDFTVSSNYIGGTTASCGGAAWTKTNAFDGDFDAIYMNVGTVIASNIQGNTIRNFSYSNAGGRHGWYGIYGPNGYLNVGTTSGNTIGDDTGTGSITLNGGTDEGYLYGIYVVGEGNKDVSYNKIGSVTVAGTDPTHGHKFYGIINQGSGTTNIRFNTIGSETTAGSINLTSPSTALAQPAIGILNIGSGVVTISNNLIAHMTNGMTSIDPFKEGYINGILSMDGSNTISDNIVHDLTIANTSFATDYKTPVIGIALSSTKAVAQSIKGNTIYNLSNSSATSTANVYGLYYSGGTTESTVSGNFIHSLSANSAGAALYGLKIDTGSATFSNNIISLGTGISNGSAIYGIKNLSPGGYAINLYFNTVNIEGSVSGNTESTYALSNTPPSIRNYRNNIFSNTRSGGTSGKHYAVSVKSGTYLTMDYNDYYAPNGVLGILDGVITTLSAWKTATGQDLHSVNKDPKFASAGGTSATNYLPSESSLVSVTGTGITTDYSGASRSATLPAMGAYDYEVSIPIPVVTSVSVPVNRTYIKDRNLDFTVNYDQDVIVTETPSIIVTLNTGGEKIAGYVSGSGTSALVFRYTVVSGDYDNDGVSVGTSISLNGGTIKNTSNVDARLVLNSIASTTAVLVNGIMQASSIVFSSVTSTQMTIGWTNGNGSKRAVFVKEGTGDITVPTNNTTYTASADWLSKGTQLGTSGYYCVYNNIGNSVTLTGLTASTQYTVQVFDYNGDAGFEKYYTNTSTDNPKSQSTTAACTNPTVGGTVSGNQSGCTPFDPVAFTSTADPTGQTGTLEYKWQYSTTSGTDGFTDIASSNAATFDPPSGLTQTTWYRRLARAACMSDWTGAATSNVLKITINPISLGGIISGSATVCAGTNSTMLTLSGYSGSILKWQKSTDNWTTTADIENTTTSLTATNLSTSTKFRAVVQSGDCNAAYSSVAAVSVTPPSVGGSISGSGAVCPGTNNTILTLSGYTGNVVKWQKSTDNWETTTDVESTRTSLVVTDLAVTTKYRAVLKSGDCYTANSSEAIITVNPFGQANQPLSQTICSGSASAAVVFTTTNTEGTTTYSWSNSKNSIGLSAAGSGNIASFTPTNVSSAPVVATIEVTPYYSSDGATCWGRSKTFTITVNPTVKVDQPTSQTVGNGKVTLPVSFTTSNTGGSNTYNWTNSNAGIGLASTGTGNIASFTAVNNDTAPVVATIEVTPFYNNDGAICEGGSKKFTITVNPSAQVNQPADQTLCSGSATAAITFTTINKGGTTTYAWSNSNTAIGLAASGTGDIASFKATNDGSAPIAATLTVTPTYVSGGVITTGAAKTFTIKVNPTPAAFTGPDKSICLNSSTSLGTFAVASNTYSWISAPAGFTSSTANLVVTPLVTTKYTLTETITATGCSATNSVVVTINPLPAAATGGDRTICPGTPTTLGGPAVAGNAYVWGSLAESYTSMLPNPVVTPSKTTKYEVTEVMAVTGCTNSQSVTVTVKPTYLLAVSGLSTVCSGDKNVIYSTTPGMTTYQWTIPSGASIVSGATTSSITVDFSSSATSGNVRVSGTTDCGTVVSENYAVTVNPIPAMPSFVVQNHTMISNTDLGNQWYLNGSPVLTNGNDRQFTAADGGTVALLISLKGCQSPLTSGVVISPMQANVLELDTYPNPNTGQFELRIEMGVQAYFTIDIFNDQSQLLYRKQKVYVDKLLVEPIDLTGVPTGTYIVRVYNGEMSQSVKVIIRR